MFDTDPIHAALAEAQAAVRPLVRAPGVGAARSLVRRRRMRRTATLVTLLLLVLGLGAFAAFPPRSSSIPGTELSVSPTPTCSSAPVPSLSNGDLSEGDQVTVTLAANGPSARQCPGETIRVAWAAYLYQKDGTQRLYLTSESILPPLGSDMMRVRWTRYGCGGDLYYLIGDLAAPQSIPAGHHWQYPPWVPGAASGVFEHHLQDGRGCGES